MFTSYIRGAAREYYGGPSYDVSWLAYEESHKMFLSHL